MQPLFGAQAIGPNVSTRRILQPTLLPVASPGYIEKHGRPGHPSDLAQHLLIREKGIDLWRAWFEAMGCQIDSNVPGDLRWRRCRRDATRA